MKFSVSLIGIILLIACRTNTNELDKTNQNEDPCLNEISKFNTISVFKKGDSILPTKDFFKMVKFLESKGNMKLESGNDSLDNDIYNGQDVSLKHEIFCPERGFVTQTFILKNVTRTACNFKSTIAIIDPEVCTTPCKPEFYFQQCNFADNKDRDSALKIVKWVFSHLTIAPDFRSMMDHENQYAQVIVGEKRFYLLMPGFQPYEPTALEYAGYLKQYLKENNLD